MDISALARYYKATYNSDQMAHYLALANQGVMLPPDPPADYDVSATPTGKVGRPTAEQLANRKAILRTAIAAAFPQPKSIPYFAQATGLAQQTVQRLRHDPVFLRSMPVHLRAYFEQTSYHPTLHLPALWQGILTLHYYAIGAADKGHLDNLFVNHAALWTGEHTLDTLMDSHKRTARNAIEQDRLKNPTINQYFDAFNYDFEQRLPINTVKCADGCPIVAAYLGGSGRYVYLEQARQLIDEGGGIVIPWVESKVPGVVVDSTRTDDVIAHIIGGWF